jgi:hypothetical protein
MVGKTTGAGILVMFITLVIAFSLQQPLSDFAANAKGNTTGAASTFYGLFDLFYALVVVGILIAEGFATYKSLT